MLVTLKSVQRIRHKIVKLLSNLNKVKSLLYHFRVSLISAIFLSACLFADYMQSLCKNHFLQQLYRKIDGAVLWSQNERNLDCVITFQTHSILQRFMLRFDMLQLDCNDHLLVYDGAHAVSTPKVSKCTITFSL